MLKTLYQNKTLRLTAPFGRPVALAPLVATTVDTSPPFVYQGF